MKKKDLIVVRGAGDLATGTIHRLKKAGFRLLASFLAVLEPTLVIILSVIVGIILLSVMLPLLGIMAGL